MLRDVTLAPPHLDHFFALNELKTAQLHEPSNVTERLAELRIWGLYDVRAPEWGTALRKLDVPDRNPPGLTKTFAQNNSQSTKRILSILY